MVDSSVGGKTGVNLRAGKNLAGAFHQPRGVFIATGLLATLPPREFAAGMAEVIKTALLGDAAAFRGPRAGRRSRPRRPEARRVVRRCCAIKARIVEADERELRRRAGGRSSTSGTPSATRSSRSTGYGTYLHGEAVAIGLCAAARLSQKLGLLGEPEVARVEAVVAAHALPTRLRAPLPLADLMAAMARDKKVRAGAPASSSSSRWARRPSAADVAAADVEAAWREVGRA